MTDIKSCDLLLLSLTKYYSKSEKICILKDIVSSESPLSLRLIDWYVTNYCKQHNIVYILKKKNENEYFNVYMNYRSQLKAFKKILFDPFRRRDRIMFHYENKEDALNTTIGQLNFFRWAIDNDVIKHLEQNIEEVENDMLLRQKTIKSSDILTGNKKQTFKYSKNSIKNMTTFSGNTLISFK